MQAQIGSKPIKHSRVAGHGLYQLTWGCFPQMENNPSTTEVALDGGEITSERGHPDLLILQVLVPPGYP